MPTLLNLLSNDLRLWSRQQPDGVHRSVLLWLDPHREFGRLVSYLGTVLERDGAQLLIRAPNDGVGQLALKLRLLSSDEGLCIVYLPGYDKDALEPQPDGGYPGLWALYEYRYTGCIWGRGSKWEPGALPKPLRLYEWLRAHGLEITEDRGRTTRELTEGGAESLLARYAEKHRETTPAVWPRPLRADDVRADLAGDPRDTLRELFAAPGPTAHAWTDPTLTLGRLADEFGLSVPSPLPVDAYGKLNGHALADELALQLALAEAWDAFGRPDDFPYRERLPRTADQRARQVDFVRNDIMSHTRLGPLMQARMEQIEHAYPLAPWAAGRTGEPAALPVLARQRWQVALSEFDRAAAGGLRAVRAWLTEHETSLTSGAAGPWDGANVARWSILAQLASLCAGAEAAHQMADGCRDAATLIQSYTQDWWQLDAAHLEILAAATGTPGLERVRQIADLALFEYVNAASDAFSEIVERGARWPLSTLSSVDTVHAAMWKLEPHQRRAVIISDAFRWDLAQRTRMMAANHSRTVEVEPVLSTAPSITPFGMAALLPLERLPPEEATLSVNYETKSAIKDGAGRTLSTRDGRKALLEAIVRGPRGESAVRFADMDQVLAGADIPQTPLVVVFDNDIDQQGHKGGDQFPRLALELAANVARTIERLHDAGVSDVHVVTDHGFLLLPPGEVDALGRPDLPVRQAERRESRWAALKPDAPVDELFRLPCPLDPHGPVLGFPRGVRTLVAAEPYEHGGISLHECVLPHL
ncbi:MAG TPA: PglZ domain-containing protein, partial [Ktedonobacterales bacterium]|nr:PglZ domain-containing protein [Ktedonobacterales bacterium]